MYGLPDVALRVGWSESWVDCIALTFGGAIAMA